MMATTASVVIVGSGRLGSYLATRLDQKGCAVNVIDRDARALSMLPEHVAGTCVQDDLIEFAVFRQAGIETADFLMTTTSDDDVNLTLALVGSRVFGTKQVIARVDDPSRAEGFLRLDIQTICPTTLVASAFLRLIDDAPWRCHSSDGAMKSLFIVVVGCGRLGSHLANLLSRGGHRVVVIDQNPSSFSKLSVETYSGFRVEGDASEPAVLRSAKIEQADLLITATHHDNVNLMVALVAKRVFGVQHVMARVYDPGREEMYHDLGLETVCPTLIAGDAFFKLVSRAIEGEETGE
jgi:trk system potassium uptake protein TrkA